MKFTPAIAAAILTYCWVVGAAPTPEAVLPNSIPDAILISSNKAIGGIPDPSFSHTSVGLSSVLHLDPSEHKAKTRGLDLNKLLDSIPGASALVPEELRQHLKNHGSVSDAIDHLKGDHLSPRSALRTAAMKFPRDEMTERVRGHDRLNEAERLRQVTKMKKENPSMGLRQKDINRITEHMLPEAIAVNLDEFCNIVEDGAKYYELLFTKEDFGRMCKAKYDEYNAFHDKFKDKPDLWEIILEDLTAEALKFTNSEWERIYHEDRAEIAEKLRKQIDKLKKLPGLFSPKAEESSANSPTPASENLKQVNPEMDAASQSS